MDTNNKGIIFIVRHGPTHDDDLCFPEMSRIIDDVTNFINENNEGKIRKVFTSPYERCDKTASMLMKKLNINPKRKEKTDELSRIQSYEKWSDTHARGYRYGKHISNKYKDKNVIVVTHSSILLDVVKGVVRDQSIKKEYLHPCSVTIIKNGEITTFNKGWSEHK